MEYIKLSEEFSNANIEQEGADVIKSMFKTAKESEFTTGYFQITVDYDEWITKAKNFAGNYFHTLKKLKKEIINVLKDKNITDIKVSGFPFTEGWNMDFPENPYCDTIIFKNDDKKF